MSILGRFSAKYNFQLINLLPDRTAAHVVHDKIDWGEFGLALTRHFSINVDQAFGENQGPAVENYIFFQLNSIFPHSHTPRIIDTCHLKHNFSLTKLKYDRKVEMKYFMHVLTYGLN